MTTKINISSLDHQGRGIGKIDGKIIFIPNSLPGEEVNIKIISDKKKYSTGKVVDYTSFSSDRKEVICPYFEICGGCDISHISYEEQLKFKKDKLVNILKKYSNIDIEPIIIKSKEEFFYRNKISLKIENKKWGYYEEKSHNLIEIDKCLIAKNSINKIIELKQLFDIKNGEIIIRSNYNDEILITITSDQFVNVDIPSLRKESKIAGIVLNDKIIHNQNFFFEKVNDKLFKVNYKSFFQANHYILEQIINILNKKDYKTVVDLYCGVGVLGASVSSSKLYGIESSSAVKDALQNALSNKIKDSYYINGDSSKISEIKDEIDLLIIDPPRKGIDNLTIKNILASKPNNIAYISCDPMSLSRDLNLLTKEYKIDSIYLADMFPQTYHVETVVFMSRVK